MIRSLILGIIFTVTTLSAQGGKEVNSNIMVESISESIKLESENTSIHVQITCQTNEEVRSYSLGFDLIPARWAVISAELNGEPLWLLQSDAQVQQEEVLVWEFEDHSDQLILYPFKWQKPYVLDLELQANIENQDAEHDITYEKILLDAQLAKGVYSALATGRGNIINVR